MLMSLVVSSLLIASAGVPAHAGVEAASPAQAGPAAAALASADVGDQAQPAAAVAGDEGAVEATPAPVTAGIEMVAASAYVWRGFVPVSSPVLQPNAWVKVGNLTVSSWMNIAVDGPLGKPLTESDFTADYTIQRGASAFSVGYVNYLFPDLTADRMSHEIYVGWAHSSYLNPAIKVYQDVGVGSGTYVSAAVAHTYALPWHQVSLTPSLAIGYNHRQWIEDSTFSDLTLGVKVSLPAMGRFTVSPFVHHSRALARDLFRSRTYGGVALAVR